MRLVFQDTEDLSVVSALLQDALVRVGDIARSLQRGRFAFMANRFRWEEVKRPLGVLPPVGPFSRVRAGVHFDGVSQVLAQGVSLSETERVLELLDVSFSPAAPPGGTITLTFAGEAALALVVECVEGAVIDVGEPWPSAHLPRHAG